MKKKAAFTFTFTFIFTFAFTFTFALTLSAADYPLLSADTPQGPVSVVFTTDAPALSLDRDLTATLSATAPAGVEITLPPIDTLRSRFQGFSLAEGFSTASFASDGRAVPGQGGAGAAEVPASAIRWRLRADPAAERYRLAPFAVGISTPAGSESRVAAPLLFPLASLPDATGPIEISPRKFFVWPGPRFFLRWAAIIVVAVLLILLVRFAVRRIRHAVRVHRMSPSERAFYELDRLLGSGLVERGLFKDFYVELTHVVRRYIERAYGIHAPRQTTDEFLVSAKGDRRFGEESVSRLSGFLRSADMVKFAGVQATPDMASNAATSARDYIRSDAAAFQVLQTTPTS